ncbi:MAG: fused MFS/spermidine synthase [Deltaproteobacteria bacterium]|nr:fused MFS/spermidine synthase [Deltaproteobacteria bacterium]
MALKGESEESVLTAGEDWLLLVALVCFFFSGAAGLVYEVVWTRMLTQVFGNTTYAIATVLSSFMAGLALGSYLFGRIADQGKNGFLLYGVLEFGVGLYGLVVPWLFELGQILYIPLFRLNDGYPLIFNLLLFFLSFFLLVLPTLLMGATLPVLSRFFVRSFARLGERIGDLYGTNTMGAVLGCGLAGYYLIPALGMRGTVFAAVAVNLVIALIIFAVDRVRLKESAGIFAPAVESDGRGSAASWLGRALLFSFALSGFAALVYENAWTRALTLVIGSSVYSFTTMLVTFLVGLALGGFVYARLLANRPARVSTFGVIELGVGLAALATIPLFEKLPLIFLRLLHGFGDSFSLFLTTQALLSALVMFLPALLLGMTFPLVAHLFTRSLYHVGSSVGVSYAANTVGAILGAFAGGFIFIPVIGVQNSILLGVAVNFLVGWFLIVMDPQCSRMSRLGLGVIVMAALLMIFLRMPRWDRYVLTSGVTIYSDSYSDLPMDSLRLEEMRRNELLYYREGLTATVSVHRSHRDYFYLTTNGKIDGSHGDALTMLMTGYLPMLLLPEAERVAIIGLGTGMTVKAVGAFPVRKIEVLEIEPAMAEAAAFFSDANGKILEDPRVRVIPTDGRNYMVAAPHQYDLIISEPSNPWIAGVASLFTKEFYAVTKGKLKAHGIFAQWFHNYSMSPDDFRMVLRTFAESFPFVTVWNLQESDFLLVGSLRELEFDYPRLKKLFLENGVLRGDFKKLGLSDIYALLGFYRMGKKELLAFAEGAEFNTDDSARLEYSAPRSLGKSTSTLNQKLLESFVADPPWGSNSRWVSQARHHYYMGQAFHASGWSVRALKEAEQAIRLEPSNADYHLLLAKILLAQDKTAEAAEAAGKALLGGAEKAEEVLALADDFYTTQAEEIYKRIVGTGVKAISPYLGLGGIALHRKDFSQAQRRFAQAAEIQPKHPAVLFALGRLRLATGNHAEALTFLLESQEKGEDSAALYGELGQAYSGLGQWENAARAYGVAVRRQRKNIVWRLALADALTRLGKFREAEQRYREVLALDPNSTQAWKGLKHLGKRF